MSLSRHLSRQFLSYLFVGGAAFVVDYSSMIFLVERLSFNYIAAAISSFMIGLLVNFFLCRKYIFSSIINSLQMEFMLFFITGITGVILCLSILHLLVSVYHINYKDAKLVATAVVFVFNFLSRRVIIFSHTPLSKMLNKYQK
ncbi:GtrA family protein [Chitinibacter fontanus]|uniref:GtrA family protein n=1 Tax=Chitinibacter fontanus TaxID=1737446 RepID=A0A7D5ZEJ5_9NEIS|nr:GtrA family protein [Chitinibacter fontanus]